MAVERVLVKAEGSFGSCMTVEPRSIVRSNRTPELMLGSHSTDRATDRAAAASRRRARALHLPAPANVRAFPAGTPARRQSRANSSAAAAPAWLPAPVR